MWRIGTAGWSIPRAWQNAFSYPVEADASSPDRAAASHLERYARRFSAVEINSSLYRHHRRATYARWAAAVPSDFRFAVKLPRTITHDQSLVGFDAPLDVFLEEVTGLGDRLGALLVQLPPSLVFHHDAASEFFAGVRAAFDGAVVCEPRHTTWFNDDADALVTRYRVARVLADPACVSRALVAGVASALVYARLHGSPDMYRSTYSRAFLETIAQTLIATQSNERPAETWCIFDNTTLGAATGNALDLQSIIGPEADQSNAP